MRDWAELAGAIFNMRDVVGIAEQIRRLSVPSHEALDTGLVVRVAGRYVSRGFTVRFEPNGEGCSDLLVENSELRSYVEIKRENEQAHRRWEGIHRSSQGVLGYLEPRLRGWLENHELRVEIKLSRLFSVETVPAIGEEIDRQVRALEACKEQPLDSVRGSRYVVLPRLHEPFYRKGAHTGLIKVKKAGTPVQAIIQNMPILVVLDWVPNLGALKRRLQKASTQLRNDSAKDSNAQGFFVVEASHGEAAKDKIVAYFPMLPTNCLGVVLLSAPGYVVPRSDVPSAVTQILAIAGTPSS